MVRTPTHQLKEALALGRWQGGEVLTDRERLLVEQLVEARNTIEGLESQLTVAQGEYRRG